MTTQSEGGGRGGRCRSPSVHISNLSALSGVTRPSAASPQSGGARGHPSGSTSASQQARERYTSVVPALGSSSKMPSCATSAMGPTTSAPLIWRWYRRWRHRNASPDSIPQHIHGRTDFAQAYRQLRSYWARLRGDCSRPSHCNCVVSNHAG